MNTAESPPVQTAFPEPVDVWGIPLTPLTFAQTLDAVESLIERRAPSYFVTANLHYAMVCDRDARLREVNRRAAFVVADGMPLVWESRRKGKPLPERVAGADLVPALCARGGPKGWRVFLLGGAPGVMEEAAAALEAKHPGLKVVGTDSPPFRPATPEEHAARVAKIRDARPDLLFVAFGQPKGELWIAEHFEELGVPVCAQIGGSLDMLTGKVKRAPKAVQRVGLEWAWRAAMEPRRLGPRYAGNAAFLAKKVVRG